MAGEEDGKPDISLDEQVDMYFAPGGPGAPKAEGKPPADAPEDKAEAPPEDEPEDKAPEEPIEEEGEEEPEEEEPEGEPEEEEPKDEEGPEGEDFLTVSADELELIEKDPTLKKVHRMMRADYTRKTTAIAERERKIEGIENQMRDPDKSAAFLAGVYQRQPTIAAAALEQIATGDMASDFLVAVGLQNPTLFEQAFDRVREIADDPAEKKRYDATQAQQAREAALERREGNLRQRKFDADLDLIYATADREAEKLSIDAEEMADVKDRINEVVRGRVDAKSGSVDLSTAEVKALVKKERVRLDSLYEKAQAKARKKLVKDTQDATKRKATAARERPPAGPASVARRAPKEHVKFTAPEGVDPLDAYIDHRFRQMQ